MSTGLDRAVKDILQAITESAKKKTNAYDTQATVKRVDGNTAWVHIPGGVDETPVKLTVDAKEGDVVQVRVGGGKAWITGNQTAPPTDDTQANAAKKRANLAYGLAGKAISTAEEVASDLDELASEVADISEIDDVTVQYCLSNSNSTFQQYGNWSNTPPAYVAGKYYWTRSVIEDDEGNVTYGKPRYSQDTQLSVETDVAFKSNNNHFWYDSSGAYVTTQDKSYRTGSAVRITASGILQQVNGNTVSSWTNSGISFLQGGSTVASFGSGGVNLYGSGYLGASITSSGMMVYSRSTSVADFGSTVRIGARGSGHISVSSTKLEFYDSSTRLGYIKTESSVGHFEIEHNSGNAGIVLSNGAATVHGNTGLQLSSSNGKVSISGSVVELDPVVLAGTLYSSDYQESTSATANTRYGASSKYPGYYKIGMVKSSSSRRYKHDIKPIEDDDLDPHNLYDLGVVQFVYNKDYLDNEKDDRYDRPVAGFVAEEMREIYPTAVDMENGRPETWNPRYIIPPMLALIQEQNKRITKLEERL